MLSNTQLSNITFRHDLFVEAENEFDRGIRDIVRHILDSFILLVNCFSIVLELSEIVSFPALWNRICQGDSGLASLSMLNATV